MALALVLLCCVTLGSHYPSLGLSFHLKECEGCTPLPLRSASFVPSGTLRGPGHLERAVAPVAGSEKDGL